MQVWSKIWTFIYGHKIKQCILYLRPTRSSGITEGALEEAGRNVIVFDSDPIAHVQTIRSLFERLRKHNLKLSPSKARLGATEANFLGHSISLAGLRPNAEKVSALANMPMPEDVKQVRALMGGINYLVPGMILLQFFAPLVQEAPSD